LTAGVILDQGIAIYTSVGLDPLSFQCGFHERAHPDARHTMEQVDLKYAGIECMKAIREPGMNHSCPHARRWDMGRDKTIYYSNALNHLGMIALFSRSLTCVVLLNLVPLLFDFHVDIEM
jgi:hypothetical protein